jgi:hypothetical protein
MRTEDTIDPIDFRDFPTGLAAEVDEGVFAEVDGVFPLVGALRPTGMPIGEDVDGVIEPGAAAGGLTGGGPYSWKSKEIAWPQLSNLEHRASAWLAVQPPADNASLHLEKQAALANPGPSCGSLLTQKGTAAEQDVSNQVL